MLGESSAVVAIGGGPKDTSTVKSAGKRLCFLSLHAPSSSAFASLTDRCGCCGCVGSAESANNECIQNEKSLRFFAGS